LLFSPVMYTWQYPTLSLRIEQKENE